MFVTAFVISNYLELEELNEYKMPYEEIKLAIDSLKHFRDLNEESKKFNLQNFWGLKKRGEGQYESNP